MPGREFKDLVNQDKDFHEIDKNARSFFEREFARLEVGQAPMMGDPQPEPISPVPRKHTRQRLVLTRGLPASGKTTWSKRFAAESSGQFVRICRDDLRAMLGCGWDREAEKIVVAARDAAIRAALKQGRCVVVDETFCRGGAIMDVLQVALSVTKVVVHFAVFPDGDSLERNLNRPSCVRVPGEAVERMMQQRDESQELVAAALTMWGHDPAAQQL